MISTDEFDEDMLAELREDLGESFAEFVAQFQSRAGQTLDAIESSLNAGEHEQAANDAHGLRGTAGYFGALALQTHLRAVQLAAQSGDIEQALLDTTNAREAFDKVSARLANT